MTSEQTALMAAINGLGWQLAAWMTTTQLPSLEVKRLAKEIDGLDTISAKYSEAYSKAALTLKLLELLDIESSEGLEQLDEIMKDPKVGDLPTSSLLEIVTAMQADIKTIYSALELRLGRIDHPIHSWDSIPPTFFGPQLTKLTEWIEKLTPDDD